MEIGFIGNGKPDQLYVTMEASITTTDTTFWKNLSPSGLYPTAWGF